VYPNSNLYVKHLWQKFYVIFIFLSISLSAKPAELSVYDVTAKMQQAMKEHATYKTMCPLLAKRALQNFVILLDTQKALFLESEVDKWLNPTDELLQQVTVDFEYSRFDVFQEIFALVEPAIERRRSFEVRFITDEMPKDVSTREFKDITWCKSADELYRRLFRLRSYQVMMVRRLTSNISCPAIEALTCKKIGNMQYHIPQDKSEKKQFFCTQLLKALVSGLDSHSVYLTPGEANQFITAIEKRLSGIGASLLEDAEGFRVSKIIEGGPAQSSDLRIGDKIIAIDHEPVVGLDSIDVIENLRGKEGSVVIVTVIREVTICETTFSETKDISINRSNVVLNESRVEASFEPFGSGGIAVLKLHAFYQDAKNSSSSDLEKAFKRLSQEGKIQGVILDLRSNPGGLLTEAVDILGLFLKKGVVASTKDEKASIVHYRNIDTKMLWDGPLIVLINRLSASASEVVSQTLQDYKRAVIMGDDHSYGKGTFQTFTLALNSSNEVDPQGEYVVTRGKYYTVSGKTPQLVGVQSDIIVPGELCFLEIGEEYTKYPLENDEIPPSFDDSLQDVSFFQRNRIRRIYEEQKDIPLVNMLEPLDELKENSRKRLAANKLYNLFFDQWKKLEEGHGIECMPSCDFQMQEAVHVMKDYICIMAENHTKNS